jgi:hypothetical protein
MFVTQNKSNTAQNKFHSQHDGLCILDTRHVRSTSHQVTHTRHINGTVTGSPDISTGEYGESTEEFFPLNGIR